MKSPTRTDIAIVAAAWLAFGAYYVYQNVPPVSERVPGLRDAWKSCDGTDAEKREVGNKVAEVIDNWQAYLTADGKSKEPKIKTAQQAARLRYEYCRTALANTGFCNKGCRFQAVAEVATAYLAKHLGVATDYELDKPFPNRTDRTGREQFSIVAKNLALGLRESAP